MKIVINNKYGGFGLSNEAIERYLELRKIPYSKTNKPNGEVVFEAGGQVYDLEYITYDLDRSDSCLIQTIEELGEKANGRNAELIIVEVNENEIFYIEEDDGWESVKTVVLPNKDIFIALNNKMVKIANKS